MYKLVEECKVVNLLPPKDISAAAHSVTYVDLKHYNHVDFIVQMGATGGIGSSISVTFKEAVNTSGSSSASFSPTVRWSTAAAVASSSTNNDTYVKNSISSGTFDLTPSSNNITYVVPVDADEISDGLDCVGIGVQTTGAATLCGIIAILSECRLKQAAPPSAL